MTDASKQPWVDGLTIGQVLTQTAQRHASRDAVVCCADDVRLSYAQFDEKVQRTARGLLAMGIKSGEHVAVWATNVPEWVILQFATAKIGAVLVNINPAYRSTELKYVLKQSDTVALFLIRQFKTSNYFQMLEEVCPQVAIGGNDRISCDDFPRLRNVVTIDSQAPDGAITWDQMLAGADRIDEAELDRVAATLSPDQPINIQYTSGTTGFPKAATLSHRNLLLNTFYSGQCQTMSEIDRICIPVPFYHCFGCVLGTLCAVVHGAAMIVPGEHFNPEATLDAIESERATVLYGVPTMFIAQLEHPTFEGRDLTSLRTGIMAGSPCPIEVMRQVVDKMGAREITIGYGQTEASPLATQTRWDDPLELRVETVGRNLPGVEIKIIDPDSGATLGDNEQGEFCSRGHGVMIGYYNQSEATAAAIDDEGWLHSGDLAVRTPDGYYRITGRIKDMIIRGGENISPREIEDFLLTHPAIEQAAIVGVPDSKYGEEICAWVILKELSLVTADEVRRFCKASLAHYKVPRYVEFVDSFPLTVTGKIQKFKIREIMAEQLGAPRRKAA